MKGIFKCIHLLLLVGCRIIHAMSLPRDAGSKVITASCTLLPASQMVEGRHASSPAAVQAITLHTSSQKIVVPVAAVAKQSAGDSRPAGSSDSVDSTAPSLLAGSGQKHVEASSALADTSHKSAPQKTGPANPVTRRVRSQAKPNISKNARTRWLGGGCF